MPPDWDAILQDEVQRPMYGVISPKVSNPGPWNQEVKVRMIPYGT